MSDTPETDAQSPWRYSITTPNGVTTHYVPADFARNIERERNKAEAGWLECRNFAQRIVDERDRYKSEVEVITRERDEALNKAHNYEQGYLTHATRADTLEKERNEAREENLEQANLLGMGGEREARLITERDDARKLAESAMLEADQLRGRLALLELERDQARAKCAELQAGLDDIEEYGTEEINAAVDLRHQLAAALCERDEWKAKFIQANKDYGFELMDPCGTIWDHAKKLQQERDELKQKTGYWESLIHWLEQVQKAFEGKDRTWDLTQLYARGPFAGWSQEEMVRLADELWENEQKYPLRGDKK